MTAALLALAPDIPVAPTVRELALVYACRAYDATPAEFKGPSRCRHLTYARALFVWIIRTYRPAVSYPVIGRWLNRDHTSIIHLSKRAAGLFSQDDDFRQDCARFAVFLAQRQDFGAKP